MQDIYHCTESQCAPTFSEADSQELQIQCQRKFKTFISRYKHKYTKTILRQVEVWQQVEGAAS